MNRSRIQSSSYFTGSYFAACCVGILVVASMTAALAWAQAPASTSGADSTPATVPAPPYQPKFQGDPAHSDSEAQALGYMRVVLRAQREYKKRHQKFATSLEALAGTGSFTKRMAHSTDRGDYTASFQPRHAGAKTDDDGFILTMTPNQLDAQHRSFYAEDDGKIHAEEEKPADANSPVVK